MSAPWTAIGVPIDSVGRAGGTERAPAAVREHGLPARLGAEDRGDLDVRIRGDERDPVSGVIGIADTAGDDADACARPCATSSPRAPGRWSSAAAARSSPARSRACATPSAALGVAYVDGHVDVYDGATSPTGEGADMPMSVAFGLGPEAWVRAAGGASAAPADVVVLGARDPEEARDIAELRTGALADVEVLGPDELRAEGLAAAGARAAQRLAADGGRFWIHLDVDVLDERAMPATDYLMPGGLQWDELAALMRPLGASPGLAGLSLGCLNPEKDPGGAYTEKTCALLAGALAPDLTSAPPGACPRGRGRARCGA